MCVAPFLNVSEALLELPRNTEALILHADLCVRIAVAHFVENSLFAVL